MIAYFLSLYPSKSINIPAAQLQVASPLLIAASETIPGFSAAQRVYSAARSRLPSFIADRLPSFEIDVVAPIPPTMTPKILKEALLTLASEDKLSKLPADTPNLLIFNNATTA